MRSNLRRNQRLMGVREKGIRRKSASTSVNTPGVINKTPAANISSPSTISSPGMIPCARLLVIRVKVLIPSSLTRKAPSRAVTMSSRTVFSAPNTFPIWMRMESSTMGTIAKRKKSRVTIVLTQPLRQFRRDMRGRNRGRDNARQDFQAVDERGPARPK
jgi:hypothetical protein